MSVQRVLTSSGIDTEEMNSQFVYYYLAGIKTPFSQWLGCATKLCKEYKKDKVFCHIRPETNIYHIGNELYECERCHKDPRNRGRNNPIWLPPKEYTSKELDRMLNWNRMTEAEVREMQRITRNQLEEYERHPPPPELTLEEEKARIKRIQQARASR